MVALSMQQQQPSQWRDFDGLKRRVDCARVAEDILGRQGKPVSSSGKPAVQFDGHLTVFKGEGGYYEFSNTSGTKESGHDVYELLIALGIRHNRVDAYDWLAEREGFIGSASGLPALHLVTPPDRTSADPEPVKEPSPGWQPVARQVVADSEALLFMVRHADKLARLRKRIDPDPLKPHPVEQVYQLIKACHVGYLDRDQKTGLLKEDGKPLAIWPAGLLFPYFEGDSLPAVQCRPDNKNLAKTVFLAGSKPSGHPLILRGQFDPAAPTIIVEGNYKGMAAALVLPDHNVIVTGSAGYKLPASMIDRLRTVPIVYLAMDTDENGVGQRANAALADAIGSDNLKEVVFPFGKDVDGFIAEGGDLVELLASAAPVQRPPKPIKRANDPEYNLPDTWRGALNDFTPDAVAPVIDLFYTLRRTSKATQSSNQAATYSISELVEAADQLGWQTSRSTITRGLSEGTRRGLFVCQQIDCDRPGRPASCYKLVAANELQTKIAALAEPIIVAREFSGEPGYPLAPVQSAYVEGLITAFEPLPWVDGAVDDLALDALRSEAALIASELDAKYGEPLKHLPGYRECMDRAAFAYAHLVKRLNNLSSSPLPEGWVIKNSKGYKAALLHAVVRTGALPEQPKSYEVKNVLGVSKATVHALCADAGIKVTPVFAERIIRDSYSFAGVMPGYNKAVDGFFKGFEVDGEQYTPSSVARHKAVEQALADGKPFKAIYQQTSELRIIHLTQPTEADKAAERQAKPIDPSALLTRVWCNRRAIDGLKTRLIASDFEQYFGGLLYPDLQAATATLNSIAKKGAAPDMLPAIAETARQACTNAEQALKRYAADTRGAAPKQPDMTPGSPEWCKRWAISLITNFTSWQRKEKQLIDSTTGEMVEIELPNILAILRSKPLPEREPSSSQAEWSATLGVEYKEVLPTKEDVKALKRKHKEIKTKHAVNARKKTLAADFDTQATHEDGWVWDPVLRQSMLVPDWDGPIAAHAEQVETLPLPAAQLVVTIGPDGSPDLVALDKALKEIGRQALRTTGNAFNAVRAVLASLDSTTKAALLTTYPDWQRFAENSIGNNQHHETSTKTSA